MEAEDDDRALKMTAEPHLLRHGAASKAFASLARIVTVISNVPPVPDAARRGGGGGGRGLAVDLNLRLGLTPLEIAMESPEEEAKEVKETSAVEIVSPSPVTATSPSGEKISEVVEEGVVSPAVTAEKSSIDECDEERAASEDGNGVSGGGGEGYLWLLLEAVRHVSGKSPPAAAGSKRRKREGSPSRPAAAAAPPPVRSRRRRNQELPLRYRDSVLEPWVKLPTAPRNGRLARSGNRR